MRKIASLLLAVIVVAVYFSCNSKRSGNPRVLVFTKTTGFRHASIPDGIAAIQKLGKENGFDVDTTENADMFNEDTLKKYSAVIFLSTTGHILDSRQRTALERYIQAGGGFVGVHSATDTEYDWGWYGRLVGAYFVDHPGIHDTFPNVQPGVLDVVDQNFIATKHLPAQWKRTDEFYSFKKVQPDLHVLIKIDESSYNGGHRMGDHPMSWYHEFDGGRAFYTELGHTSESYSEPDYLKHLLGGIQYAIGDNNELDYSKAKSQYAPDEDRFTKVALVQGTFFEPTEMTILPNMDILVLQRRGEIMRYDHETKKVKQVGFLNVYWHTLHTPGVNAEEGMLGLCKDPHFAQNHWVYIYYSPADTSVNRLSRFTFENDTLDPKTEKVILDVHSQREICCHTGGSIAFGPDGLLYFSAGDNSTPFDEPGAKYVSNSFAPQNDIPGHEQYDARRSAGNTNDLRGKIMRIKVNDDGTYSIPPGNLFPPGTPKTRPEIYVMGDRNPYRISVDQKNSYLYWGEVGPDANFDSLATRGPRGYDEVNQARKAGFFGWPFFVGNNYAYHPYNYATGEHGPAYDPEHPVNNSRNNTGLVDLPPAQPAFIWYPYAASPDFPEVGTGGRNAMAGPVYYTDMFPKETRYPDYYNGKLFIYDWIRGWIKVVTMLPNGDFDKMEPFMEHTQLHNCIDMEVGPDGRLYLLEYGTGWFQKNPDAGLSVVDYTGGNRPPHINSISVDKTAGSLPFAVKATVDAKDPENDKLTYTWDLGNGTTKETNEPQLDYTYTAAGDYKISVEVKDNQGASEKSDAVSVYAGNEIPVVNISLQGSNKSFYLPGQPVKYSVTVTDKDDTSKIDPANLFVSVDYIQGYDKASVTAGGGEANIAGKVLTQTLDCKSCHKEADKSIGPAFMLVSQKYAKDPNAMTYLSQKIMKGGSGVWGDVAMAAHPNISQSDLDQILHYILGLTNKDQQKKSLPASGTIVPPAATKPNTSLVLTASYTDKGGNNIKALTGRSSASLGSSTVTFTGKEKMNGFTTANYNGANYMLTPKAEGWFAVDSIDLTGVGSVNIMVGWQAPPTHGFDYEIRLDGENGKVLGTASLLPQPGSKQQFGMVHMNLAAVTDGAMHTLYFVSKPRGAETTITGIASLQFNGK
ncbi:MAG TPA: ThuA domain-containing protein [Chitinophagaceae bacterium]|nr:ThuA domain-containing protein [Chitinophagaceae bacterium]